MASLGLYCPCQADLAAELDHEHQSEDVIRPAPGQQGKRVLLAERHMRYKSKQVSGSLYIANRDCSSAYEVNRHLTRSTTAPFSIGIRLGI